MDPTTAAEITKNATEHFTWIHMMFGMVLAGLTGGFFNPVWKYISNRIKGKKDSSKEDAIVQVAEIEKDINTEANLWKRVESLEKKLQEEIDKRLSSETAQNDLKMKVEELRAERLNSLTRYIKLRLRVEEFEREVNYLKSKLRETNPNFDVDYPKFNIDINNAEEKHMEKIILDSLSESKI